MPQWRRATLVRGFADVMPRQAACMRHYFKRGWVTDTQPQHAGHEVPSSWSRLDQQVGVIRSPSRPREQRRRLAVCDELTLFEFGLAIYPRDAGRCGMKCL